MRLNNQGSCTVINNGPTVIKMLNAYDNQPQDPLWSGAQVIGATAVAGLLGWGACKVYK